MLKSKNFQSIFKEELEYFVKAKRSSGLKYHNELYYLFRLDFKLSKLEMVDKIIDVDVFDNIVSNVNFKHYSYIRYYQIVIHFCKFLIELNYDNIYYKTRKFKVYNTYVPRLLTDEQIAAIFKAFDEYNSNDKLNHTYSIIFRLLYSTGLRISEVCNLKFNDICLDEKTIKVINSKRNKSRLIAISDSMATCLIDYFNKYFISKESIIFERKENESITPTIFRGYFKKMCLQAIGFSVRVHDLRHNYVNRALNQMTNKGYEDNVIMAYLYRYLGHCNFSETEYYIRMTTNNIDKIRSENKILLDKVYGHEK